MALTRKFLSALGIEDDKADQIIEAHVQVKDELKAQIDDLTNQNASLKAETEKIPALTKQLEELEGSTSSDELEKVKAEFEDYKKQVETEKVTSVKKTKLTDLLKKIGVNDTAIDKVIRVTDLDSIELDDKNNIKDGDKLEESLKNEWSGFITTTVDKGTNPTNPPAASGKEKDYSNMSMEEYIAARSKE